MSESFVDLSYRGLALGRRVKLTQVRATTGYLEMPAPMPVGTAISIATDEGVAIAAVVSEIHEQVGGSDRTPGMLVTPSLEGDGASWWQQRADATAVAEPPSVVTVTSRRTLQGAAAVPDLVDDGRNTSVMDAVDDAGDSSVDKVVAEVPLPPVEDDGKRTIAMDAVDLAALGLDPAASSGVMKAITDDDSAGNGKKKKRKKR